MRLAALAVVFGVAVASCGGGTQAQPEPTLDAGSIVEGSVERFEETLASLRGRPVIVNFWATWCEPCKTEMPRLVSAANTYGEQVRFIGVNVEDDRAAAERFAARNDVPFPSLADRDGRIRRAERVLGLPVTQFYRADGQLAFVHNGEVSAEDLKMRIEELIRLGRPVGGVD